MLFDEKDLLYIGVFKKDYQAFIDNIIETEIITEIDETTGDTVTRPPTEAEAYSLFVFNQSKRAENDIINLITIDEFALVTLKTTGNALLEGDIREAELLLTAYYMLIARLNAMEDFLNTQSDGRISLTVKEYSKSLNNFQKQAYSLIKRWFNE